MKGSSLFFCKTDLQSLIINELVRKNKDDVKNLVIYAPNNSSHLHKVYFRKIESKNKIFLPPTQSKFSYTLSNIFNWYKLPKAIREKKYDCIYFSSLGCLLFSFIAARNTKSKFFLFADGAFNLRENDFFNWVQTESLSKKIARYFFNGEHALDTYQKLSIFFTIYPLALSNWMHCPVQKIKIFHKFDTVTRDEPLHKSKVKVFIGSFFAGNESKLNAQRKVVYDLLVKDFKADLHIPHPGNTEESFYIREDLQDSYQYKDESYKDMIAEDIIYTLLRDGYKVSIYGIASSVLFNMSKFAATYSIALDHEMLSEKDLMKSGGIKLLKGF